MNAASNVILFRRQGQTAPAAAAVEVPEEMTGAEELSLVARARRVLDDIEAAWEDDHGRPDLRDKIHLLRYYLRRFPERTRVEEESITAKEE